MNSAVPPLSPSQGKPVQDGWILIVDDHPLFCDALELTMRSVVPGAPVRTTHKLADAIALVAAEGPPSLIVLDLNLPDVSGLEGAISLRRAAERAALIIVSSLTDNRIISAAFAAGVDGFVPKHSARTVLEEAVRVIETGQTFHPPCYAAPDAEGAASVDAVDRLSNLTAQQARILELICEGKLNKQIAYDLSIAETTVKAHVTAIMRKLGVQSRTQAVLVAQEARFATILPDA
ncbi:response regulator transcription factor [Aliishimia ponticola]|uniref:Response regulator transcription factor n=1 Tax=Aliishimia ponticola TaxID=2499833 RepID=A0A4S4NIG6_9RHOB|nr:response regulator transcription factor [Aliishimia ponticola]THH35890.1 response regulator transcription factor [Aliishimia ponticola]